jgi:hypothetical protein
MFLYVSMVFLWIFPWKSVKNRSIKMVDFPHFSKVSHGFFHFPVTL